MRRLFLAGLLLSAALAGACRCGATITVQGGDAGTPDAGRAGCDAGSCGGLCCQDTCVVTASCGFSVTSVTPNTGWQNGGDWVLLQGTGFASGLKAYIGDGRAPVRVIDSTHALLQTPPGAVGAHAVKVVVGSASAVLPGAFSYASGGIEVAWAQKPMATVRGEDPGVAVMQDGGVLVAGGTTVPDSVVNALNTAEIYDPNADVVLDAGTMSIHRWQNSAVTLLDGRVLVVGGACFSDLSGCVDNAQVADLFDPATRTFTAATHLMTLGRSYTRAVLLPDGRVFVASSNDSSVEIYDPALDTFTQVAHGVLHRFGFVVRLRDGRVLIGGGDGVNNAETFDPDTNTFSAVGALQTARSMLTAHTLPDGRVLLLGGTNVSAGAIDTPLASLEAFDPVANTFSTLPYSLATPRAWLASALLRNGQVLAAGGYTVKGQCSSFTDQVEAIDPVLATVSPFATLLNKNCEWNAVTLQNGSVLAVGGGACGTANALPDLDFLPGGPQ